MTEFDKVVIILVEDSKRISILSLYDIKLLEETMVNEKLSVIISIYNVCDYLDKCVNSVINQTYKNLEIILIDDGSTDRSSKMCDNYASIDKRIVVCHKVR